MALNTQTIGTVMPNGQAGSYARQPDMIINTKALGGSDAVAYGTPLVKDQYGKVVAFGATNVGSDFYGIAGREIKTALNYASQGVGKYEAGDPVAVFQRGCINVKCQRGTPAAGGAVYIRITANASYPTAVVGGFEASADSTKTVQVPGVQWEGAADSNGIAELRILSLNLGDLQGVAVANAAGAAPTAAEFKALLDSLRDAGVIANS